MRKRRIAFIAGVSIVGFALFLFLVPLPFYRHADDIALTCYGSGPEYYSAVAQWVHGPYYGAVYQSYSLVCEHQNSGTLVRLPPIYFVSWNLHPLWQVSL